MKKLLLMATAAVLTAQPAFAGYNPFLAVENNPAKKEPAQAKPAPASLQVPIPPPVVYNAAGSGDKPEDRVKPKWEIVGRVGNQIALAKVEEKDKEKPNGRVVVENGTEWDRCFVFYPQYICDKQAVDEARKMMAHQAQSKRAEEATITELRSNVERLKVELATVKADKAAPPEWFKGKQRSFEDTLLGKVTVSTDGEEVYFQCDTGKESDADAFFGKNALRKEKKGDYVYYALRAKAVRIKE